MSTGNDTAKLVDHLFRREAGKMVAILTHTLGLPRLQTAEDAVQDAFIKALQTWKLQGIPENPGGWLLRTARNSAIDTLRRSARHEKAVALLLEDSVVADSHFHPQELADSQLRMMFACCHPALRQEDQVALTLKIVCSFSIAETARALTLTDEVVQKRLSRARAYLRDEQIILEIPAGASLQHRLDSVHAALYLLFNEGYLSLQTDHPIRYELCAEAMRCCKLLTEHALTAGKTSSALLALMCLHAARFNSRTTGENKLVLLAEQDRSCWDHELIQVGLQYLNHSAGADFISSYHIEAAIAAEHCMAPTFSSTNWKRLLSFYDLLLVARPLPVVHLNRAVVLAQSGEIEAAIASVLAIQDIDRLLLTDHMYSAVLGDLYRRLSNRVKARAFLEKAYALTTSPSEKKLLRDKLDSLHMQN